MRGRLGRAHVAGMTATRHPLAHGACIRETFTRIGETAGRRERREYAMRALLSLGLLAALGACTAERAPPAPPEVPADVATDAAPASPSPSPSPAAETPASAAAGKSAATPDGDLGMATFAGYGEVKFGTLAVDMGKAWGGALKEVGKDFNASCYFMTPAWVTSAAASSFLSSRSSRNCRTPNASTRAPAAWPGSAG